MALGWQSYKVLAEESVEEEEENDMDIDARPPSYSPCFAPSPSALSPDLLAAWTVLGAVQLFECTLEWLVSWLPFYNVVKAAFLIALTFPETRLPHLALTRVVAPYSDALNAFFQTHLLPELVQLVLALPQHFLDARSISMPRADSGEEKVNSSSSSSNSSSSSSSSSSSRSSSSSGSSSSGSSSNIRWETRREEKEDEEEEDEEEGAGGLTRGGQRKCKYPARKVGHPLLVCQD
ncbi:receptor expression-enhancing protein 4 [Nannochloropsis oceanica]